MPNWCANKLIVELCEGFGEEKLTEFIEKNNSEKDPLTFGKLIPFPEEIESGNKRYSELQEKGFGNWNDEEYSFIRSFSDRVLNWARENWGTKWDIAEVMFDELCSTKLEYNFETAWCPPDKWLQTIAPMFPGLNFELYYWEPGCQFSGVLKACGKRYSEEHYNDMNDEIREVFGFDEEEYIEEETEKTEE